MKKPDISSESVVPSVASLVQAKVETVSSMDIRSSRGKLLRRVREGVRFLIERRGHKFAMLVPYDEELISGAVEEISSARLSNERGEILDRVRDGAKFVVVKRGRKLALLMPYREVSVPDEEARRLLSETKFSAEQLSYLERVHLPSEHLEILSKLSLAEIEFLVRIVRGLSLVELVKKHVR